MSCSLIEVMAKELVELISSSTLAWLWSSFFRSPNIPYRTFTIVTIWANAGLENLRSLRFDIKLRRRQDRGLLYGRGKILLGRSHLKTHRRLVRLQYRPQESARKTPSETYGLWGKNNEKGSSISWCNGDHPWQLHDKSVSQLIYGGRQAVPGREYHNENDHINDNRKFC